jgi:hypothetical protein
MSHHCFPLAINNSHEWVVALEPVFLLSCTDCRADGNAFQSVNHQQAKANRSLSVGGPSIAACKSSVNFETTEENCVTVISFSAFKNRSSQSKYESVKKE